MMSLPELETLPEVALARDLLRSWYGLDLAVVGAEHFAEVLRATEPCRTVAGSLPAACAASWAEQRAAILASKGAAVHRCHAGVISVAAPIPGHEPPRGAVIARPRDGGAGRRAAGRGSRGSANDDAGGDGAAGRRRAAPRL
jgi:hypothetical protein